MYYFETSIFGDRSKKFLKAHLAPIYNNFEERARAEKTQILVKIFKEVPKNGILTSFLKNFACGPENLATTGFFSALGELDNQFGRPNKKDRQIFENF